MTLWTIYKVNKYWKARAVIKGIWPKNRFYLSIWRRIIFYHVFLIMLPDTNKIDTLLLCHRLHKLIAGIKVGDSSLTISIGMSICNEPYHSSIYLFKRIMRYTKRKRGGKIEPKFIWTIVEHINAWAKS
jgi:hypothetical protein